MVRLFHGCRGERDGLAGSVRSGLAPRAGERQSGKRRRHVVGNSVPDRDRTSDHSGVSPNVDLITRQALSTGQEKHRKEDSDGPGSRIFST